MAKVTKSFEFITALQIGEGEVKSLKIIGQYYPNQCTGNDDLSYDIEQVLDGYQNAQIGWTGMHDLMTAYNIAKWNSDKLFYDIASATENHISYLLACPDERRKPVSIFDQMAGCTKPVSIDAFFGAATDLNTKNIQS